MFKQTKNWEGMGGIWLWKLTPPYRSPSLHFAFSLLLYCDALGQLDIYLNW